MSRKAVGNSVLWLGLAAGAIAVVLPFIWLFLVSIKPSGTPVGFSLNFWKHFIPTSPSFQNYLYVWQSMPLPQFFLNSVKVVVAGVFLDLFLAAIAGYALARFRFRGSNLIFSLILVGLFFPGHMTLLVNFVTVAKLGLYDTLIAVVLPSAVTPLGIFLMRQTFSLVPRELEDAARVDGASEWMLFWRVMLPMAKPGLVTLAILDFTLLWNALLWPMFVLKTPEKYTLSMGLLYLQGAFAYKSLAIAAGAVIAMVPTMILFLVAQKHFVKDTFQGAFK
ncbi:MAG: carbohydrate ABC transporter permease [Parcubacteria group bacterium]|nr:carbohydrate ABC transporter permease [Parcubacteria group bacterium]